MRYLMTGKEMKAMDMRSIEEYGIPSLVLMERAAFEVANVVEEMLGDEKRRNRNGTSNEICEKGTELRAKDKRVLAVCGLGNNGADGVAVARILYLHGAAVSVLLPFLEGKMSSEMEIQLEIAKKLGISVYTPEDFIPGACDVVIDALFGIGLTRPVEGVYADMISLIREQAEVFGAKVVSVDIPSGISSDTGAVMGCAAEADVTVTFGEMKLGQVLFPGREACGRLVAADIGFVPEEKKIAEKHILAHTKEDLCTIPKRKAYSHKGTYGKLLVIAGSKNMAGAAYFAAKAAYRTGAGLVKVMTTEENRFVIQEKLPEAILSTYDTEWALHEPEAFKQYINTQTDWADAIVLGPGIGTEEYGRILVETVLGSAYVPIILDADAINLAARYPYLKKYFTENIILTPHLSECARLTGLAVDEIKDNLIATAQNVSETFGVTCVLKDAATVVARKDGKTFVNMSGTPAMAKGGAGDVLCGVIAGLLALGMEECEAASLGVYVHGLAGEAAEKKTGTHSVLAGELADCVGEVINENI